MVSPDDAIVSRKKASKAPRDNVNFEYGLSVGILGLSRSILMVQDEKNLKIASDLGGLTQIRYSATELKNSVRVAFAKIKEHIERYSVKPD